jgi:hypothetical protein
MFLLRCALFSSECLSLRVSRLSHIVCDNQGFVRTGFFTEPAFEARDNPSSTLFYLYRLGSSSALSVIGKMSRRVEGVILPWHFPIECRLKMDRMYLRHDRRMLPPHQPILTPMPEPPDHLIPE